MFAILCSKPLATNIATGDGNMWLASGGDWFFDLNDSEQKEATDLLLKFHHLPHIIEI
ncbi:hypothetical protein EC991775_1039, partial [Escherichia coli 99.1775]